MLTIVAVAALVAGLLGLLAGGLALRTLGRLRRSVGLLARGSGGTRESLLEATGRYVAASEATRREFDELNLSVLRAVDGMQRRLEDEVDARHDALAASHGAIGADIDRLRAALDTELAGIKAAVDRELGELRDRYDQSREEAFTEIKQERLTLLRTSASTREQLDAALADVQAAAQASLRRVALVRFDAFDELSGRLSFCLVLLDGRGDGIALTSLSGRTQAHLYAKPIEAGRSTAELSPEEQQAVKAALGSRGAT